MYELKQLIEKRKNDLEEIEYQIEDIRECSEEDIGIQIQNELENLQRKSDELQQTIDYAEKEYEELVQLKRQIDSLDNEYDGACSHYQGANSERAEKIKCELNRLESNFSERYDALVYNIKN